jgi:hypothetical protein
MKLRAAADPRHMDGRIDVPNLTQGTKTSLLQKGLDGYQSRQLLTSIAVGSRTSAQFLRCNEDFTMSCKVLLQRGWIWSFATIGILIALFGDRSAQAQTYTIRCLVDRFFPEFQHFSGNLPAG